MVWQIFFDLVVKKSGAAEAIGEAIEHKDGGKYGKANRRGQLLLIVWAVCKPYNSENANSWAQAETQ